MKYNFEIGLKTSNLYTDKAGVHELYARYKSQDVWLDD
jgi:hypothetical protein